MADGLSATRGVEDSPSNLLSVQIGPPRQTLPDIITPGLMVISTQSGKAAIVTVAPSFDRGSHPSLLTDSSTFTIPILPTTLQLTPSAPTEVQSAAPSASPTSNPSHGLSTAKVAAIIVVPLVLLAILSPIAIVWYISWRRKRRAAKRRSDRSSGLPKPLGEHYHRVSGKSRPYVPRASSNLPPPKPWKPHRIVSVPTPTFSKFNFQLSRPASVGPVGSSRPQPLRRIIPRDRRSATFSWGSPPPYASPTSSPFSSTPAPRLNTPDITGSPFLETAQMAHIGPISGQHQRLERSNSRLRLDNATSRSRTSLTSSHYQRQQNTNIDTLLDPLGPARARQGSADSYAESLHHRSTLQRPFSSFQPPASPALTEVSGLSFDPILWASTSNGRDSTVSPIDDQDGREQTRPYHMV
ncbi:MAG: hypothetical protein LQ343_000940 [Gyalolechia ehrenbergii]|nr:MAG: hypothetical protein LQ343_000940 [Gyalolechia ehrenbergii]